MLKKIVSAILTALLVQAATLPAFAATTAEKDAKRTEKIRTELSKLGTGKDARVKLELRDKTKVEGYLREATQDHIVVTDDKGSTTSIPYPQVKKAQGNNLSTGAKIAIGAAAAAAIILFLVYHAIAVNEQ